MPRPKKNRRPPTMPDTPSAQLLAEKPKTPATLRGNRLFNDSDSEEEFHSAQQSPVAGFKINEAYARRFEHNKKREELHQLEEKFGANSKKRGHDEFSEDESSSSEDEDDVGVLVTEKLDQEIFATLAAIKNKDPKVYDGKTSFYAPIEETLPTGVGELKKKKKEKPMFLRDYHRENLLAGNTGEEKAEEEEPQTFVQQQESLKRSVVKEMHKAAEAGDDGDDDDDGFLVKKPSAEKPEKEEEASDLPNPQLADEDPDEFLQKFLTSRAWAKPIRGAAYVPLEEDDSEDDELADQFEANYNMRFEDPDAAARSKLVSYGRDAISENTVRRQEKSRRKKAREEKRRKKEEEKAQREVEKGRLKKLKTEELLEKFRLVKEAADLNESDEEAEAAVLSKLLEGDFSDREWDGWMQERFGDKYYQADNSAKKPKFDDDIDIRDIVSDLEDDAEVEDEDENKAEDASPAEVEVKADEEMVDADADEEQPKKKSKKEIIKEKQERKAKERSTRRKVERFVEDNFDFESELGSKPSGFRYRETTPETFGLQTLDILAADDAALNSYAGLKKYAAFRDPEKKKKDKKRYAKKKLLKKWRKEVFGDVKGVQMPSNWKPEGLLEGKSKKFEEPVAGKIDIRESGDGERKKKRRKKNKA